MDIRESIRSALKDMILPELEYIRKDHQELKVQMELTNKRLDDMNRHLVDQSRRIDETNKRIDETNKRIDEVRSELTTRIDEVRSELSSKMDEFYADLTARIDNTNLRIDQLTFQAGKIAQEVEKLRKQQDFYKDVLLRIQRLEDKVMGA